MLMLRINGEDRTFSETIDSVGRLLAVLGINPHRAAVEVNRTIVNPELFETTPLHSSDRVEIVSFVGGG